MYPASRKKRWKSCEKERVRERVKMPPLQILKKKGEKSIATRAHVWYYK